MAGWSGMMEPLPSVTGSLPARPGPRARPAEASEPLDRVEMGASPPEAPAPPARRLPVGPPGLETVRRRLAASLEPGVVETVLSALQRDVDGGTAPDTAERR